MPTQITCASALPGKTGKHKITFFTRMDCVTRIMHLCTVFLKEKNVICDVGLFDSVKHLLRWKHKSVRIIILSVDFYSRRDKEQLPAFTATDAMTDLANT